jgi:aryl-alcohol dehydrogenase-like predicted oxidoreductase
VKAILQRMAELGGTVIDTAAAYGESEGVICRALAELGIRERMFISTKFNAAGMGWSPNEISGRESFERSLQRLRTARVDLLEVHRLPGLDTLMPVMQEYKQSGRIRYLGVTTFRNEEHGAMAEAMRKYPLDFIQIDYSLGNRRAAKELLPLALERKVAVMVNVPLGGRRASLISEAAGRKLPPWAAEIEATSWSQFFLKYVVAHPAVTCVIPGSTQLQHLEDNQAAGRGRLPDAALRRRMEEFWDAQG